MISPLTTAWRLEWALVTDQAQLCRLKMCLGGGALGLRGLFGLRRRHLPVRRHRRQPGPPGADPLGLPGRHAGRRGHVECPTPLVVGLFRAITGFSVGIGVPAALTTIAEIAPARGAADD